ncbi:hypothetical protein BV20DRAFT_559519 [Pilatotrama ljubarskyi]|nr:hypothetical protein BV20DRAFT_559519 [Pilatotrama ljubarskyi]
MCPSHDSSASAGRLLTELYYTPNDIGRMIEFDMNSYIPSVYGRAVEARTRSSSRFCRHSILFGALLGAASVR